MLEVTDQNMAETALVKLPSAQGISFHHAIPCYFQI